jgi:hypothetical protein
MKEKRLKKGVALLAVMSILALAGCPQPDNGVSQNSEALLTAITVAGVSVDTVPAPVSPGEWSNEDFALDLLDSAQVGTVVITQESSLTNAAISVTASAGAAVKYAAADFDTPVDSDFTDGSTLTLTNNGYLCIQVTPEDKKTVNYYVVEIKIANTVTSLTAITVAGIQAIPGTPNADYNQAVAGSVGLSAATKDNAAVTVTKANGNQTVKYAKVTGSGTPVFGDTATFTFTDGDFLYIEVTAENGIDKGVYKIEIQVGRDTTLSTFTIGGTPVIDQGTPGAAAVEAGAGSVLFNTAMPSEGFAISITPTDTGASIKWASSPTGEVPASFGTVSPIPLTDEGYLYVEVTAANGTTKGYYKIQINLLMSATIKYGQPEIKASTEKFIDTIWNSVMETYRIAKVATESSETYKANPTTTGIAKALFDETGLYIYVDVTDPAVDTTGSSAPTKDSVELFINEGVDADGALIKFPIGYADKGGQYRVDADGVTSGDPAAASAAVNPAKVSAWTKDDNSGYVVIFQAPWRFLDTYPLAHGKKVGFELQINACSNGGRDGVVVWNNIAHTNYQNVSDYGEATLDADGHDFKINAKNPVITAHPLSKMYQPPLPSAVDALTVTASSPDGGTLTYQWYSNTTNNYGDGTAITGATDTTYTPSISFSSNGTYYYWVAVTNTITDNGDDGTKTATAQSGIASIVVSAVPLVEKIVAGSCGVPVYRFTLPPDKTWNDYKAMTYTVMITDSTTLGYTSNQIRSHIVGNYTGTEFGATGELSKLSNWGTDRLVIIANNVGISNIVGAEYQAYSWKELTYDITTPDSAADKVPAVNAAGPFYLGIGFAVNNSNVAGGAVTYYVKDVALVGTDNSKIPADPLDAVADSLTLGQLKVKFQEGPGVTRTMEPEPSAPPSGGGE